MSLELRAEQIAAMPPQLVADVRMYSADEGGRTAVAYAGWGCPCMASLTEPLVGYAAWPQLGDTPLSPGDSRRAGFVFINPEGAEIIRRAGTFFLWEGKVVGEGSVVGGGALDLPVAFEAAQTGGGCIVPNVNELVLFAEYVASRGALVCNVETHELEGEFEIARIDLGIYGWEPDQRDFLFDEKTAIAIQRLAEMIEDVGNEEASFIFRVWVELPG